jgi:mannose-6-phosphate isomerase-like protein (cupin superfamily)
MTVISDPRVIQGPGGRLTPGMLGRLAADAAAEAGRWSPLVRFDPARRWYCRMDLTEYYELWLLSWQPGQSTGFHDHGGSSGAFVVALGELEEQTVPGRYALDKRTVEAGRSRTFGPRHVHRVLNGSPRPAVSVHAYSPPLPQMRRYELSGGRLRYVSTEPAEVSA